MTKFPQFLIDGHQRFKDTTLEETKDKYERLADQGQKPGVLIVGCSDSRVDPITIFHAEPGDLFVVRNVANIVPPYETQGSHHGVSSALEFGILHLGIEHVLVLGHAGCGGIKAVMDPETENRDDLLFVSKWVRIMSETRDSVLSDMPEATEEEKLEALELRAINTSLSNLMTFPFVKEKVGAGQLSLHGGYFDVRSASLFVSDPETKEFSKI